MRKSKSFRIFFYNIFLLFVGFVVIVLWLGKKHFLLFKENDAFLNNPDRGIYMQRNTDGMERFAEKYALYNGKEQIRLVLLTYDLSDYTKYEQIPEEKLDELRNALDIAKQVDVSIVFRAAYDFDGVYNDPPNIDLICNHVKQIAEILMEYGDELICIQAGLLGPWGEWHSSEHIDTIYTEDANQVLTTWLENTEHVDIALRRPSYLRAAVSMGADATRLTVHNDALLSNETDMGTYNEEGYSREDELTYLNALSSTYFGGEMSKVSKYTDIENAVDEFSKIQISYLNRYYNQDVWDSWAKESYSGENAEDYIIKHLGYRLSLYSLSWYQCFGFQSFEVDLLNSGFGKLDSRYQVYLLIEGVNETKTVLLEKKDSGLYVTSFWYVMNRNENYRFGILISRRGEKYRSPKNNIQLANDDISYEQGVNYLPYFE